MVCIVNKDMINNIVMNILHKILAFGNSEAFVSKRRDVVIYLLSFIEQSIEFPLVILAWSVNLTDGLMRTFTNKHMQTPKSCFSYSISWRTYCIPFSVI